MINHLVSSYQLVCMDRRNGGVLAMEPQELESLGPRIHGGNCRNKERDCLRCHAIAGNTTSYAANGIRRIMACLIDTLKRRCLEEPLDELPVKDAVVHGQDMERSLRDRHRHRRRKRERVF